MTTENQAIVKTSNFLAAPIRKLTLGLCAEGKYDEARAELAKKRCVLTSEDVDGHLECRNLQACIERGEGNYRASLNTHLSAAYLVDQAQDILKARYHSGLGITYEILGKQESSSEYFEDALTHYELATVKFQQAGDMDGAGDVENNVGMCLLALGRFGDARDHLAQARAYFVDQPVKSAQVDETEARVCLAENKSLEALRLVTGAVQVFICHNERVLLLEALRTLQKAAGDCAVALNGP